jgi:hypothetical protein
VRGIDSDNYAEGKRPRVIVADHPVTAKALYENLKKEFKKEGVKCGRLILLTHENEAQYHKLIGEAFKPGDVIISTLIGRASDIKIAHKNGAVLYVAGRGESTWRHIQKKGRWPRFGANGEVKFFCSLDDAIFQQELTVEDAVKIRESLRRAGVAESIINSIVAEGEEGLTFRRVLERAISDKVDLSPEKYSAIIDVAQEASDSKIFAREYRMSKISEREFDFKEIEREFQGLNAEKMLERVIKDAVQSVAEKFGIKDGAPRDSWKLKPFKREISRMFGFEIDFNYSGSDAGVLIKRLTAAIKNDFLTSANLRRGDLTTNEHQNMKDLMFEKFKDATREVQAKALELVESFEGFKGRAIFDWGKDGLLVARTSDDNLTRLEQFERELVDFRKAKMELFYRQVISIFGKKAQGGAGRKTAGKVSETIRAIPKSRVYNLGGAPAEAEVHITEPPAETVVETPPPQQPEVRVEEAGARLGGAETPIADGTANVFGDANIFSSEVDSAIGQALFNKAHQMGFDWIIPENGKLSLTLLQVNSLMRELGGVVAEPGRGIIFLRNGGSSSKIEVAFIDPSMAGLQVEPIGPDAFEVRVNGSKVQYTRAGLVQGAFQGAFPDATTALLMNRATLSVAEEIDRAIENTRPRGEPNLVVIRGGRAEGSGPQAISDSALAARTEVRAGQQMELAKPTGNVDAGNLDLVDVNVTAPPPPIEYGPDPYEMLKEMDRRSQAEFDEMLRRNSKVYIPGVNEPPPNTWGRRLMARPSGAHIIGAGQGGMIAGLVEYPAVWAISQFGDYPETWNSEKYALSWSHSTLGWTSFGIKSWGMDSLAGKLGLSSIKGHTAMGGIIALDMLKGISTEKDKETNRYLTVNGSDVSKILFDGSFGIGGFLLGMRAPVPMPYKIVLGVLGAVGMGHVGRGLRESEKVNEYTGLGDFLDNENGVADFVGDVGQGLGVPFRANDKLVNWMYGGWNPEGVWGQTAKGGIEWLTHTGVELVEYYGIMKAYGALLKNPATVIPTIVATFQIGNTLNSFDRNWDNLTGDVLDTDRVVEAQSEIIKDVAPRFASKASSLVFGICGGTLTWAHDRLGGDADKPFLTHVDDVYMDTKYFMDGSMSWVNDITGADGHLRSALYQINYAGDELIDLFIEKGFWDGAKIALRGTAGETKYWAGRKARAGWNWTATAAVGTGREIQDWGKKKVDYAVEAAVGTGSEIKDWGLRNAEYGANAAVGTVNEIGYWMKGLF